MRLGHGSLTRTPWWCWLVMIVVAVATLPGAAFVVTASEETDDLPPSAEPATDGSPGSAAGQNKSLATRVYRVDKLLNRIRSEQSLSEADAKEFLKHQVRTCTDGAWHDGADPSIAWFGKELVVRQMDQHHNRVRRALNAMREYGFAEIAFSIKIANGPPNVIDAVSSSWTIMPPETGEGQQGWRI